MAAIAIVLVGTAGTQEIVRITLDTVQTAYESHRRIDLLEADEPRDVRLLKLAIKRAVGFGMINYFYIRQEIN